jgi:Putative amidoligase enzyme
MKVKNLLKAPTREEQEQNTPLLCLPKTYIGLEYEWENTTSFPFHESPSYEPSKSIFRAVREYYQWHVDGSLREGGMEFTFTQPLAGTRIINAVRAMDDAQRAYGFTHSYRTSLHVHMDLSSLDYPETTNKVAAIYALVEPLLYKFVGNSREFCNYCVPWYANAFHYAKYLHTMKAFTIGRFDTEKAMELGTNLHNNKSSFKYAGMNMFSLGQFGTFEYRQAPVSMQMSKIITWINILMRMKQYSLEYAWTPTTLMSQVKGLGYTEFVERVFKDESPALLRTTKSPEEDIKQGSLTLFHFNSLLQ